MVQRTVGLVIVALALVPACGPQSAQGSTGETGATSTGDGVGTGVTPTTGHGIGTSGDGPTSTTGAGETTSPAATTGGPTGEATTGGDASSATSVMSTGDETAAPVEPGTKAWWVDGTQSDQIRVIQADPEAGICRGVWLTNEEFERGLGSVESPAPWHVLYVWAHQDLVDCFDPYFWFENDTSNAFDAVGTVVVHDPDEKGKPATIDLEVTGAYDPIPPWLPVKDTLTSTALLVDVG